MIELFKWLTVVIAGSLTVTITMLGLFLATLAFASGYILLALLIGAIGYLFALGADKAFRYFGF